MICGAELENVYNFLKKATSGITINAIAETLSCIYGTCGYRYWPCIYILYLIFAFELLALKQNKATSFK